MSDAQRPSPGEPIPATADAETTAPLAPPADPKDEPPGATNPAEAATVLPDATLCRGGFEVPSDLVNHSRYQVQELLGTGGMGAVYKARHLMMDRVVALKVINQGLVDNP